MAELEMIQKQQKAAFLSNIARMEKENWEPIWATFRAVPQSKPVLVGKRTEKFTYFILLKR